MSQNIIIRSYQKTDREAVRNICCDVADAGQPIERFFPDRVFAADLLMNYYTDYEPEASFVAESSGQVVGYINGCLDNRRYGLVVFWILVPRALSTGFKRGVFFRAEFWKIVKGAIPNWRRLFSWRKKSFHSHQGHMHIGVAQNFRQQQVGEQLIGALCAYASGRGVDEISASVHDGNKPACRFFERLGFVVRDRNPSVTIRDNHMESYNALLYVKKIH